MCVWNKFCDFAVCEGHKKRYVSTYNIVYSYTTLHCTYPIYVYENSYKLLSIRCRLKTIKNPAL